MVLKKFSRLKNSTKVDHWQWNNTNANAKAASRVNFPHTCASVLSFISLFLNVVVDAALYTHAADIDFFPFRETFAMLASSVEDE